MKTKLLLSVFLLCTALLSHGQWMYTNLSEPKSGMGSASLGNKAYFAGGNNGTDFLTKVEVYDVKAQQWSTAGNLSIARATLTGVACGSKILFAGGQSSWGVPITTVDIYDTLTQQWTLENLSVPSFFSAAVSHGNVVLFTGGFEDAFAFTNTSGIVDIYDIQAETWTTATLSQNRCALAWAVVGDLAIFAGGALDVNTASDRVDIYNFTTNNWSTATLSQARFFANATAVGNKVVIAGGCTSFGIPSDRVDIYDASTDTWTTSSLSVPRGSAFAATVNGKAYFAGGGTFNFGWSDLSYVIDIYTDTSNPWSVDYLTNALDDHSVVGVQNYLLVAGGINNFGNHVSTLEIFYDPNTGITPHSNEDALFRVYPNPGSGNIHLEISEDHYKMLLANIYNMQGQIVFTQIMEPGKREMNVNIHSGVYLLKIVSDDGTQTELITIQ